MDITIFVAIGLVIMWALVRGLVLRPGRKGRRRLPHSAGEPGLLPGVSNQGNTGHRSGHHHGGHGLGGSGHGGGHMGHGGFGGHGGFSGGGHH